jgi:hypothetical protein
MFIIIEGGGNMAAQWFTGGGQAMGWGDQKDWTGDIMSVQRAGEEYEDTLKKYGGEAGQKLAKENAAQLAQNQMAAAQSAAQSSARTSGMGKAASAALGGQAGGQAYSQNFQQGYQTELARNQQAIENAKAKYDASKAAEEEKYQRGMGIASTILGFISDERLKKIYYSIKERV